MKFSEKELKEMEPELERLRDVHAEMEACTKKRKGKRVGKKEAELAEEFLYSLLRLSIHGAKAIRGTNKDS